jgi:hypothetical protein
MFVQLLNLSQENLPKPFVVKIILKQTQSSDISKSLLLKMKEPSVLYAVKKLILKEFNLIKLNFFKELMLLNSLECRSVELYKLWFLYQRKIGGKRILNATWELGT